MRSLLVKLCYRGVFAPSMRRFPSPQLTAGCLLQQRRFLPICTVDTNVKSSDVPADFQADFLRVVSETLNKPPKLVSVVVRPDVSMCRDGSQAPTISAQIWSVGVFDAERNPGYSKIFIDFLSTKLNVPADRVTVLYHPIEKKDAGHLLYAEQ